MTPDELMRSLATVPKYSFSVSDQNEYLIDIIRTIDVDPVSPKVFVDRIKVPHTDFYERVLEDRTLLPRRFLPKIRGVFLVDVIGYSRFDTLGQAAMLSFFCEALESSMSAAMMFSGRDTIEQIVPTGDGCYIVFSEAVNDRFFRVALSLKATFFTLQNRILAKRQGSKPAQKISIRMACCLGEVDFFIDSAGRNNCYGIGMNEAQRILTCGEKAMKKGSLSLLEKLLELLRRPFERQLSRNGLTASAKERPKNDETIDAVFFDSSILSQAKNIERWLARIGHAVGLRDLGVLPDKHGQKRRVYVMNRLPNHIAYTLDNPTAPVEHAQPVFVK